MKNHRRIPTLTDDVLERFWAKVARRKSDECWEWTARTNRAGYGELKIGRHKFLATRISCTISHGDPGKLNVNHSCDNPVCVNPHHLWVGTQQEGVTDKVNKGRHPVGVGSSNAKLTEDHVKEILTWSGNHGDIAERFGVSRGLISIIKRRELWKHINEDS